MQCWSDYPDLFMEQVHTKCWFEDPDLFMEHFNNEICIWRLRNKTKSPLYPRDFSLQASYRNLTDLDHLSFVGHSVEWKRSDFEAFIAFLNSKDIFVNSQGLVITTTFPRQIATDHKPNMDSSRIVRFWSHEVLKLGLYGLPVLPVPYREVRYIQAGGPALVESSPKETELAVTLASLAACTEELDREKAEKQALAESLAACTEERDREKAEKQALTTKVSRLQVTISSLKSKNYLFSQKNM